jgi:probable F420-dependent oxidoreductase
MMEYGAMLPNIEFGLDFGFMREAAQTLEAAGFDSIAVNDHVVGGHPDRAAGEKVHTSDVAVHEPFVLLAALGAVTTRLQLVTSILILPQRPTALVAKQAAELDLLSGGRLRLGVGIGRNWMEYEVLDATFTNRGRRIEEQIEVLRRLWCDEHVTFEGEWHHLDRIGINPLPVQRPIPIWMGSFVGGTVPKVLDRIGRLADGWMAQSPPDESFVRDRDAIRSAAAAAGRNPDDISVEAVVRVKATDDASMWRASVDYFAANGVTHLKAVAATGFTSPTERLDALLRWKQTVTS